MRWQLTQCPEVVDRRHQPPAKQLLPQAVDRHARHQGIAGGSQFVCPLQPATAGRTKDRSAEQAEAPPRDGVARTRVLPADKQRLIVGHPFIEPGNGPRHGQFLLQPAVLGDQGSHLGEFAQCRGEPARPQQAVERRDLAVAGGPLTPRAGGRGDDRRIPSFQFGQ